MLKTITIPMEDLIEFVEDYILSYRNEAAKIYYTEVQAEGLDVDYEGEEE